MAPSLVPCASCDRHIRVVERACPFCGAQILEDLTARVVPTPAQRLGRSALFAFATSVAATGCGSTVTTIGDDGGTDAATDARASEGGTPGEFSDGGPIAVYGAPPPPRDAGAPVPVYGAAPPD